MRVLWLCNVMLPVVSRHLNREENVREGWLSGLAEALTPKESGVELALAFPVGEDLDGLKCEVQIGEALVPCYGFYEETLHLEKQDKGLRERIAKILQEFMPDMVHCFGTEYDHTEALLDVWDSRKALVGIQGVCDAIAKAYYADLPKSVIKRVTFRDWLKKDDIQKQKEKFVLRAKRERRVIEKAKHVTGRTTLDREYVKGIRSDIVYHPMNETLRSEFYEGKWNLQQCEPHSIFVSQGDYPLKGLHYILHAMPMIMEKYPDVKLYVAGNSVVNWNNFKDKIKISSYGLYLRSLLERYDLFDKVVFTGRLSGNSMKERMMKSHLFVCSSVMENSPNSLGEAMLLGVPCVSAGIGGVPDLFEDGIDGILYEGYELSENDQGEDNEEKQLRQARQLAEAVIFVWENESKLHEYSENAKRHARDTHSPENNTKRLLEIYCEICQ